MWPHSARPKQRNNRPIAASIGLVAAVLAVLAFGVLAPGEPSLAAGSGTWTTYHHDNECTGVAACDLESTATFIRPHAFELPGVARSSF